MSVPAFQISQAAFSGPLDLLLTLIEGEELDITAVSLARVTDEYLAYVRVLEQIDPEPLADFLVIAARLILLKSRALLPSPPRPSDEDEDESNGEALARQLREYQQFKRIAKVMEDREAAGLHSYVRVAPPPKIDSADPGLGKTTLNDLLISVQRALAEKEQAPIPQLKVLTPHPITLAEKIAYLQSLLSAGAPLRFSTLLAETESRVEVIVTFMAVLELIKRGAVRVEQDTLFGAIVIALVEASPSTV